MDELKNFRVKRITSELPEPKPLAQYSSLEERLGHAGKILIGIGSEWRAGGCEEDISYIKKAYGALNKLVKNKDYFIVTTNTDAVIFQTELDNSRIVAPCGNVTWRQCSKACTKDIWEPGEIPDDICPHCGAPLTGNTIEAEVYIEEGYMPQWIRYTGWLAQTVNKGLLVLELGEGFQMPSVIRWPFEKAVRYNQKSFLYRVNETFAQLAEGTSERAISVKENSVQWLLSI